LWRPTLLWAVKLRIPKVRPDPLSGDLKFKLALYGANAPIRRMTLMRLRKTGLELVVAALIALLPALGQIQRAEADTAVNFVFAGKCHLSAPIGFPLTGPNKGETIPFKCWFGSSKPDIPGKNNGTPTLWTEKQTKIGPSNKSASSSDGATATGSIEPGFLVGPWCGKSQGVISIVSNGGISYVGTWTEFLGNIHLTGTISKGAQIGMFAADGKIFADRIKGHSCFGAGATQFSLTGSGGGAKRGPTK
jgi:hypothetical protein